MTLRRAQLTDATDMAHVHVETWRSAYAGLMPDEVLAGLSVEARAERWREILSQADDRHVTLVVEGPSGGVVGFVGGGPNRGTELEYAEELYALYLLPAHQGRGLGRVLIEGFATHLRQRGAEAMLLWVLADNHPSRRFYEAMGGQLLPGTKTFDIGGVSLDEVAYGWADLRGWV